MIAKAFLSHATSDKHIVGAVAEQLGRASVVYDVYEFATGDDIRHAILEGISKSMLFVLFASRKSLLSDWVNLEISEAEKAVLGSKLRHVLTFIIDPDVEVSELPSWMIDTIVTRQGSPALIASDIRRKITQLLSERRPSYFLGRNSETERALGYLTSDRPDGLRPPLLFYGLPGIGRRTLASTVGRDALSLDRSVVFRLSEGDLLPETLLKVRARLDGANAATVASLIQSYAEMDQQGLIADIVQELGRVCEARALPIFLDDGAMSDIDGYLLPEFEALIEAISNDLSVDCFICSNRRLHHRAGAGLPAVRVPELSRDVAVRLVRLLARDRHINLTPDQGRTIAEYSRGYPPAIMFALQETEIYGPDQVAANRHALSRFSEEIFLRELKKTGTITEEKADILRLLSAYSPLPLPVIREIIDAEDLERFTNSISHLVDYAFIVPEEGCFRISEPLRIAAYREFGGLSLDSARVADVLDQYLDDNPDDETSLSLGQNVFRATLLSGGKSDGRHAIRLASELISLTERAYHDQDYDSAIRFGAMAVDERPRSINVRRFLAQALIRRDRFDEALEHITAIFDQGHPREGLYVRGFMERRRGHHQEAIDNYLKSIEYGRRGIAVHRELASSYFELGDINKAEEHINIAEGLSPTNRFIADLKSVIAMRQGDIEGARRALAVLERVDESGYYFHRKSSFEQMLGHSEEALQYAQKAVENIDRPPFEVLANLANAQIECGNLDLATTTLRELDQRFPSFRRDGRLGLWCKLEIRRGNIDLAEHNWRSRLDKTSLVAMGLRASLLDKKQSEMGLDDTEELELHSLREKLAEGNLQMSLRMVGAELISLD